MRDLVLKIIIGAALAMCAQGALAQEWHTTSGVNPRGLKAASMLVQQHEFAMEFYCDEYDWQDNRLGVKFFGPALPRLYGEDGDTAKLSLLFTLRDGVLYREVWDAYYFDGGLGDQAWLGNINAGKSELNALARALKLDILNRDGELVYSFGTKGTAAGVAVVRETCKFEPDKVAEEPAVPQTPQPVPVSTPTTPAVQPKAENSANALTIEQFKLKMGWPAAIAGFPNSTPSLKFAIIDSGFAGLQDYVTNTPKLHRRVRFYSLGDNTDQLDDHGVKVLRVLNEVMPEGQIYLIDVGGGTTDAATAAIKKMNELGVHYAMMNFEALGSDNFGAEVPEFVQLLDDSQTTLFVSLGDHHQNPAAAPLNGPQSNDDFAIWDSPFLIPVGAAGERDGQLMPSVFSSVGKSNTGATMPLVLGPGQIHIGEETFNGSAYAATVVAAFYAHFRAYNISNVIEHTSDFGAFAEGFEPSVLGRWGMPNAAKILGKNQCTSQDNQIDAIEMSGAELRVDLHFSRNCMEKIGYAVLMALETVEVEPTTGNVVNVTNTINGAEQAVSTTQRDKSDTRDIVDKKMSFVLDLTNLSPRFKGAKVRPKFYIFTQLAQSGSVLFAPEDAVVELN